MTIFRVTATVVLSLLVCSPAWAQQATGSIAGQREVVVKTITDPSFVFRV